MGYPDGDTWRDWNTQSDMPFKDINPSDPLGRMEDPAYTFAATSRAIFVDGDEVTTLRKDGGLGGPAGPYNVNGGSA